MKALSIFTVSLIAYVWWSLVLGKPAEDIMWTTGNFTFLIALTLLGLFVSIMLWDISKPSVVPKKPSEGKRPKPTAVWNKK